MHQISGFLSAREASLLIKKNIHIRQENLTHSAHKRWYSTKGRIPSFFFGERRIERKTDMEEKLSLFTEHDTIIAMLSGEIDHHSAIAVRDSIDEALYRELPRALIIDIGRVDFMDSSGLGLILGRYTKAKELGTSLIVRNPSRRAEIMLKMAGIDQKIRIEKTSDRKDG